jgi:DNA-binding NarL/FixJ family response regulator
MIIAEPIRIVVADDFPPVREALRKLFGEFAALEVVGEAADGNSAVEMTLHLVPEVIVMDVKMPHLSGVEATRRIKEVLPEIHVVGFSSQDDTVTREAMTTAGCSAFITKECAHALPNVIANITGRPVAHGSFWRYVLILFEANRTFLALVKLNLATPKQVKRKKVAPCTHSRMVDDVLTTKGVKTGQLVCIECKAVFFADPTYQEPN